jgi:hypothetical protein
VGISKTAFVMMPFASEFDDVYQSLIQDPLTMAGYTVFRCDDILNQGNILQDIIGSIANSSLLIADLSTSNPNVYYELGLAHAMQRPVILFAQDIDEVPFDLRSYRIIQYATHFAKMNEAIATFGSLLKGIEDGTVSFGNPVSDFSRLESSTPISDCSKGIAIPGEPSNELGLLDFREALEDGTEVMASIMGEIGTRLNQLTPELTSTTERLTSGNAGTTKAQKKLMRVLATSIDKEAKWLKGANKKYKNAMEEVNNALNSIFSGEFHVADKEITAVQGFIDTLKNTEEQAIVARDQFSGLATIIDALPRIEKEFGRASRLFSTEIKEFVGNIDQTASIFARARNAASQLMGNKPNN